MTEPTMNESAGTEDAVEVQSNTPWEEAPGVIRNWAYPLAFIWAIFAGIFFMIAVFSALPLTSWLGGACYFGLTLALLIWMCQGFKDHQKSAWYLQIVLSCLYAAQIIFSPWNLLNLLVLAHVYILLNWFKPDAKAWFGMK